MVSITVDPGVRPVTIAGPAEPVTTITPVTVVTGLFGAVGLGLPLSANDGPGTPSPAADVMGSLELVRRDLEQVSDVQAANNDRQTTTNSLVTDVPAVDLVPGDETSGSATAAVVEPAASTAADRTAAFVKAQSERVAAFTTAQQARLSELQQQLAQSPLSAIIRIPVFVVTEALHMAVFAISEVVHTAVFAVSEFFHALSGAINPDPGTVGGGGTTVYGDPVKNEKWFRAQDGPNTCVLMSSAMIIGQLTGRMPTEAEMVAEASSTNSVVDPTKKMYEGPQVSGVDVKDAVALLDRHGVTATILTYEKSEGDKALKAMALALGDNKAVMVGVHGATVWNAVEHEPMPEGERSADHQVVVIGYDSAKELVYLNDSGFGLKGQNFSVPLNAFMEAWQADNYETTVAVLKVQNQGSQAPESASVTPSGMLVTVA